MQFLVFGFYTILQHVSSITISYQVGHWFTKEFKCEKPVLKNSGRKTIVFFFFFFFRRLTFSFESFGLLNDVFPFYTILDTRCPIFDVQQMNILYYIVFPSLLGSSFGSCSQRRPFENLLCCSKVWHPLYMSEPAES